MDISRNDPKVLRFERDYCRIVRRSHTDFVRYGLGKDDGISQREKESELIDFCQNDDR